MSPSPRRLRALAVCSLILAAAATTACSHTVNGIASAPPSAELGNRLQHALDAVTSVHVDMQVGTPQVQITAAGDEQLKHGRVTAFAVTEDIPGAGDIKVIEIGNKLYARLPGTMNPTDKPWVHIRPDTTDPALMPLAHALQQIQQSASFRQYALFAQSASNFHDVGPSEANGIQAELYTFNVLVSRLPQTFPGAAALRAAGLQSLPVELWVDDQDRVRRMTETLSVAGQQTSTRVDLSKFGAPVSISPPPADQVATR